MLTSTTDPRTARYLPTLAPEVAQLAATGARINVITTGGPGAVALEVDTGGCTYALVTTDDYDLPTTRADIRYWSVAMIDRDDTDEPRAVREVPADRGFAAAWQAATAAIGAPVDLDTDPGRPLLLVACGASKRDTAAPAAELYVGPYFTECLRAARAIAADADIRIISARHGLVELAAELGPYDARMPGRRDPVAALIAEQARAAELLSRPVVVLGGRDYAEAARTVWPHVVAPLAGASIGFQRQRLARIAAQPTGEEPGTAATKRQGRDRP
ncbi:DUF6884 domain-containing protein [Nocardia salmonicida]|uniref:DUF6884 domain-containing protein n=1 Tax=Nocardia salmonicida TaxID=53431 RepID=UPI0037907CE0